MASRTYTTGQIIDRALRKADMYSSDFIEADEAMDLFNEAYAEWYDLLVAAYANYFVTETTITLTSGTVDYALPTGYYKTISLDFQVGSGEYIKLRPFGENERTGISTANIPSGTVRHRYVPAPAKFTSRSETVDGISGWETFIVALMAREMLGKEESDTVWVERTIARGERRIQEMAQNRDVGSPGRVVDVTELSPYSNYESLRYQINQSNIRFLNSEVTSPFFGVF